MRVHDAAARLDRERVGRELHALIARLYPIGRSLTGDGVRRTLAILGESIDIEVHEVPSGTRVFDWTVPREWNIRDAYVANAAGERVIDSRASNLHVVGYSVPVHRRMTLDELRPHLHSLPDQPDRIPYRTAYWNEDWGFCLTHRQRLALEPGDYEVRIDATLEDGAMTYGEAVVPGATEDEILVHAHVCHPSLCNDNLSGIAVAVRLATLLADVERRFTYRFLFLPGTIGAIAWLASNRDRLGAIRAGLVLAGIGDAAGLTYKRSRRGDAAIDRAAAHVLRHRRGEHRILDFEPYGYDERQYNSPGIDLPVGALSRSPWGGYPEYHTSGDDLDFVRPEALADALAACLEIFGVLEADGRFVNVCPFGEPQLGRRGLYDRVGGGGAPPDRMALLWVLNQSDGTRSLLDTAERAGLPFDAIRTAADALSRVGLLEAIDREAGEPAYAGARGQ